MKTSINHKFNGQKGMFELFQAFWLGFSVLSQVDSIKFIQFFMLLELEYSLFFS